MSETLGWNRVDFVLTPMLENQAGRGFFIYSALNLLKQKGDIDMAKITFKTGEEFEFSGTVSAYEAAQSLGIISREVITAKIS